MCRSVCDRRCGPQRRWTSSGVDHRSSRRVRLRSTTGDDWTAAANAREQSGHVEAARRTSAAESEAAAGEAQRESATVRAAAGRARCDRRERGVGCCCCVAVRVTCCSPLSVVCALVDCSWLSPRACCCRRRSVSGSVERAAADDVEVAEGHNTEAADTRPAERRGGSSTGMQHERAHTSDDDDGSAHSKSTERSSRGEARQREQWYERALHRRHRSLVSRVRRRVECSRRSSLLCCGLSPRLAQGGCVSVRRAPHEGGRVDSDSSYSHAR